MERRIYFDFADKAIKIKRCYGYVSIRNNRYVKIFILTLKATSPDYKVIKDHIIKTLVLTKDI